MEFIIEFLFESIFNTPIRNKKVLTWFRSVFMAIILIAVDALCVFGMIAVWSRGDEPLMMAVTAILTAAVTFGGIYMIIDGHKREWKQDHKF